MTEVARLAAELAEVAKKTTASVAVTVAEVAALRAKAEKHRAEAYEAMVAARTLEEEVAAAEEDARDAQTALDEMGYDTEEEEESYEAKWVTQAEEELRGWRGQMEGMLEEEKKELDAAAIAEGAATALEEKVVRQRELLDAMVKGVAALEQLLR